MTHTLHRKGTEGNLSNDFVLLLMAAKTFNEDGSAEKMRESLRIAARHNPINMGDMKTGNIHTVDFDEIMDKVTSTSIVHAVFTDFDTVLKVVKEIKDAELGISLVLSSTFAGAHKCARSIGQNIHTVEYSLGIWGSLDKLPSNEVLEIATMCGHSMIAPNLIESFVDRIRGGKLSHHDAGVELAKQCACGVFNQKRAEKLLEAMAF